MIIYTGGSIASIPTDSAKPFSPRIMGSWEALRDSIPFLSSSPERVPFCIDCVYLENAINSADVSAIHWLALAQLVQRYYDDYEGFVIIHGTDTLAFTASALSFLLRGITKPVVLTGAQRSTVSDLLADGASNLLLSCLVANPGWLGIPRVPEVCVCFDNQLFRGNRTTKVDTIKFDGFSSPNYPLLGVADSDVTVFHKYLLSRDQNKLCVGTRLDVRVGVLSVYPGIQNTQFLESFCSLGDLKGLVLQTFGAGSIPTHSAFLRQMEDLVNRGVHVVAVSQCLRGGVDLQLYRTSSNLSKIGVMDGSDMTSEAAYCKLSFLLATAIESEIPRLMRQDLCGELSAGSNMDPSSLLQS